ncbi:MAG: hypothetical protein JO202_07325 [Ktedonobacteraceae bacterium]|nr:hypothetical protein [Ktedonobacteraceae bacterium]
MQQAQQREMPERISWARAMIFGVGFFFLGALLVGQVPGYIYLEMTAASLEGFEQGSLALAAVCLGTFAIIQVIMLLFDPKPVVPPLIFTGLGSILAIAGFVLMAWAGLTGCSSTQTTCHQYFPTSTTHILPLLAGNFLWFQPNAIDFVMIGATLLGVGVAMVFYSVLAKGEQRNPDRRDLGTTPTIRWMIIIASVLLVATLLFYTYVSDQGLAYLLFPAHPFRGQKIIDFILSTILALAIFLTLGAFALRLHYLMRPVRKRTMPGLYAVGAIGLAQTGALLLLAWLLVYPAIDWIHSWRFIGLGTYLTLCAREAAVPASCAFTQQAGYIVDGIISMTFFPLLMAAVWAWKSHRNLVIIGGVLTTAVLALSTLLVHLHPDEFLIGLLLCAGILVLAAVWTSVARREFAVVGETRMGCVGMWLVFGTCLFIYLAAFGFFSLPGFRETETNVPYVPGLLIPPHPAPNQPPAITQNDALVLLVVMGVLAAIQFFFLVRNRYRV